MAASFLSAARAGRFRHLSLADVSPRIGLQKKPRFRGVVGRLLVWRSFFSLLLSGALSVRRIILSPDLSSSSVSLACLLPNRAAVPLMDGYEQHACQRTHPPGRGGQSAPARRVTVTLRTVRDPFLGFNPTAHRAHRGGFRTVIRLAQTKVSRYSTLSAPCALRREVA